MCNGNLHSTNLNLFKPYHEHVQTVLSLCNHAVHHYGPSLVSKHRSVMSDSDMRYQYHLQCGRRRKVLPKLTSHPRRRYCPLPTSLDYSSLHEQLFCLTSKVMAKRSLVKTRQEKKRVNNGSTTCNNLQMKYKMVKT